MNILVPVTTFPRFEGDNIPQFILGYTRSLVEAGANVTVIAPHDADAATFEVIDGVKIHRVIYWLPKTSQKLCYGAGIPTNIRREKWVAMQFPMLEIAFVRAILKYGRNVDIINPHWTFASLPSIIANQILRKPIITHAYTAEFIPRVLRPFNRFVINQSSAVISISDYAAAYVEELVSPERHEVVGYGVNREKVAPFDFAKDKFRNQIGIGAGEFMVLAVGRLIERKGYPILLHAIAKLVKQGHHVRLLHCGRGPLRDDIQNLAQKLGISDRVELLGFVPDEELRYYIYSADALVMPSVMDQSQDTEGLGIPLLEAMANDTPAIGSAIGGILSIIEDGVNGLLFPAGDADALAEKLIQLKSDPALRDHIIAGGRHTVNTQYSWSSIVEKTLNIFQECLHK